MKVPPEPTTEELERVFETGYVPESTAQIVKYAFHHLGCEMNTSHHLGCTIETSYHLGCVSQIIVTVCISDGCAPVCHIFLYRYGNI